MPWQYCAMQKWAVTGAGAASLEDPHNWGGDFFSLELRLGSRHAPDADERLFASDLEDRGGTPDSTVATSTVTYHKPSSSRARRG